MGNIGTKEIMNNGTCTRSLSGLHRSVNAQSTLRAGTIAFLHNHFHKEYGPTQTKKVVFLPCFWYFFPSNQVQWHAWPLRHAWISCQIAINGMLPQVAFPLLLGIKDSKTNFTQLVECPCLSKSVYYGPNNSLNIVKCSTSCATKHAHWTTFHYSSEDHGP